MTRPAPTAIDTSSLPTSPYGQRISSVVAFSRSALSKQERVRLVEQLHELELRETYNGVNFSRTQVDAILHSRNRGELIEFETMGPYLADYMAFGGVMAVDNLTAEDTIGFYLAQSLRTVFPRGRLVSLYDEYNTRRYGDPVEGSVAEFTQELKDTFKNSLIALFTSSGAIPKDATEGDEFWLVAESQKVADAEELVTWLESLGYIERNGREVLFVNESAENPLYYRIRLRTRNGKWLCEALDAASFLQPQNRDITHLVILPNYMKDQQDKVWEVLRVLGIDSARYHNIFFDPSLSPVQVSQTVLAMFEGVEVHQEVQPPPIAQMDNILTT